LEAFFAFWLRKNWGERNTGLFCARPNFPAAKKAKSALNVRKALPKRLLRRLWVGSISSRLVRQRSFAHTTLLGGGTEIEPNPWGGRRLLRLRSRSQLCVLLPPIVPERKR